VKDANRREATPVCTRDGLSKNLVQTMRARMRWLLDAGHTHAYNADARLDRLCRGCLFISFVIFLLVFRRSKNLWV
jgi:hypothetical protein